MDDVRSRSWFCTFNNPEEHGFTGEPQDIVDKLVEIWINANPQRTCAVIYCVSADGLKHCHAVFEDTKVMRFTVVKKLYPSMHIEPTKGNKEQAEDYINKRGKWEEKGEIIVCSARHGEIKGHQGARKDFEIIEELIEQGQTPKEIMNASFSFRRYERMIKQAYYDKRIKETPFLRDITVYWHVGESSSGKSYFAQKIVEEKGEEVLYMYTDYEGGGLDNYNGEPILFMDEFRGQIRFSVLLSMLQGYRMQVHARYANIVPLWNEVHITSVLPPELVYKNMVQDYRELDTIKQLFRRINFVVYHYKDNEEYKSKAIPMTEYKNYDVLKRSCDVIPEWVSTAEIAPEINSPIL